MPEGDDMDAAGDRLTDELRAIMAAAEELLGGRLENTGRELEEQVRRHPLAALAIAAALGVALGVLLARK
jgi:ElaB/YqjD/DUF883 family membrane-anchored ribosome-binding protein